MTYRIRSLQSLLGLVFLVAACNSSRQVASTDAASDVPTGGSDAGADRADTGGDAPAETGGADVPVDTGSDVGEHARRRRRHRQRRRERARGWARGPCRLSDDPDDGDADLPPAGSPPTTSARFSSTAPASG